MGHPSGQDPQALQPLAVLDLPLQHPAFLLGGLAFGDVAGGHQDHLPTSDHRVTQAGLHPQIRSTGAPQPPLHDPRHIPDRPQVGQGMRVGHHVLQSQPANLLPSQHLTGAAVSLQDGSGPGVVDRDGIADRIVDGLQARLAVAGRLFGSTALSHLAQQAVAELGLLADQPLQVLMRALQFQASAQDLLTTGLQGLQEDQQQVDHLSDGHRIARDLQVMQA